MRLDWLSTLNQCEAPETAKLKVMMVAEEGHLWNIYGIGIM